MLAFFIKRIIVVGLIGMLLFSQNIVWAVSGTWTQTDWSGGDGQTAWSASDEFSSSTGIKYLTSGELTIDFGWLTSWSYRKKITFNNSDQAENLTNFPVLVHLTSSNFDFSKAKTDGADIRFTDSDGTTTLDYEIEKWDDASEIAEVWVRVPQINASSNTDYIYIYYGNSLASDDQDAANVWDDNYVAVFHLGETSGFNLNNSTGGTDGSKTGTNQPPPLTSGKINGAQDFDGIDDRITAATNYGIAKGPTTLEIWANLETTSKKGTFMKIGGDGGTGYGFGVGSNDFESNGNDFIIIFESVRWINTGLDFGTGWHRAVLTLDASGNPAAFLDGTAGDAIATGSPNTPNSSMAIGGYTNSVNRYFDGPLDEVRISNVKRSDSWIKASYLSDSNTFASYSSEESGGGSSSSGTLTSSIFDTTQSSYFGDLTYTAATPANTSVSVKIRSSNSSSMAGATDFSSCNAITSATDISTNNCITDGHQYLQYFITLSNSDGTSTPIFSDISIYYSDTAPSPSPTPIQQTDSSSSSESTSSSPSGPTVCTDSAPTGVPDLFQIDTGPNSATLHFKTVNGSTGYQIGFGTDDSASQFGDSFNYSGPEWAQKRAINNLNSNTRYFFKVKAANGCNAGGFSNTISAVTKGDSTPVITTLRTQPPLAQKIGGKVEDTAKSVSEIPYLENVVDKKVEVKKIEIKEKPSVVSYEVKEGDSLWLIAQKFFGNGVKFPEIIDFNKVKLPDIDFGKLASGMKLDIDLSKLTPEQRKEVAPETMPENGGYDLDIKIMADTGSPVKGAKVTLHSTPRDALTNADGIASFRNVEPGKHTVYIAYNGYNGGGQAVNVTGDNKNLELVMQIKLTDGFNSPKVMGVITVMGGALAVLTFLLLKSRRKLRHAK